MNTFLFLLEKLLPFYFSLAIGYFFAKRFNLNLEIVSRMYIAFLLTPIVFYGVIKTPLFSGGMLIPVIFFFVSCIISAIFFLVGKSLWKNSMVNLLSFTSGTGNVGNFGIPLTVSLLGISASAPAIMANLGIIFYIQTIGYFIASKGNYTLKQTLINLAKLSPLYAFIIAICFQLFNINLHSSIDKLFVNAINIYNISGFLLVGAGLAKITRESFDKIYVVFSLLAKFIVWPIIIFIVIFMDKQFFHLFNQLIYNVMILQSITPIALSVISYSAILKIHPEKASAAVFISTLFALLYIPIMVAIFIK